MSVFVRFFSQLASLFEVVFVADEFSAGALADSNRSPFRNLDDDTYVDTNTVLHNRH